MSQVMTDAVEQCQVRERIVLPIAIAVVGLDLVIHRKEKTTMCTPSALVFEESALEGVHPKVLASSCAPVAPVAIIWTHARAQDFMPFDRRVSVPLQGGGLAG